MNCQLFSGYLPLEHVARMRKVKFLQAMSLSDNCIIRTISSLAANEELSIIADFYNVDIVCLKNDYTAVITNYFESKVNSL